MHGRHPFNQAFNKEVIEKIGDRVPSYRDVHDLIAAHRPDIRGKLFEAFSMAMLATNTALQVAYIFRGDDSSHPKHGWAMKKLGLRGRDAGIDTVVIDRNKRLLAVQEKFVRDRSSSIGLSKVGTFFANSEYADGRILVTPATAVSKELNSRSSSSLQKVLSAQLDELSPERLNEIFDYIRGSVRKADTARKPRPHQKRARRDLKRELVDRNAARAVFVSACGTGKTATAIHLVTDVVGRGGDIVVFVPSLSLVRQTIREWTAERPDDVFMAVCSDVSVADDQEDQVTADEVGFPVTTESSEIARFLVGKRKDGRTRVVFSTYHSSPMVGEAARAAGMTFAFGIFDEAHRTVCRGTSTALAENFYAHALDDANVPIRKRLFMTATPRYRYGVPSVEGDVRYISMDDETLYGRVAHRYSFGRAAKDGVIARPKVIITTVKKSELPGRVRDRKVFIKGHGYPIKTVTDAIALKKGIEATGGEVTSAIAYHSRLSESRLLATSIKHLLPDWNSTHVCGKQTSAKREGAANMMRHGDKVVATNVKVLTEGVDFPAVNMVALFSNVSSKTDIIQIVGRALRKPIGSRKKYGYVMLPVIVESRPGETEEESVRRADLDTVWRVIGGLTDEDDEFAAAIEDYRQAAGTGNGKAIFGARKRLKKYIEFAGDLDCETLSAAIETRIVERLASFYSFGFGKLLAFRDHHGHVKVPREEVFDHFKLGNWCNIVKTAHRKGTLSSERVAELEALDFPWNSFDRKFEEALASLEAFLKKHGRLPTRNEPGGSWLNHKRTDHATGKLSDDRVAALLQLHPDALKPVWDKRFAFWHALAVAWCKEKKRKFNPIAEEVFRGEKLGYWLQNQRKKFRKGTMSREHKAALTALGVIWEITKGRFPTKKKGVSGTKRSLVRKINSPVRTKRVSAVRAGRPRKQVPGIR